MKMENNMRTRGFGLFGVILLSTVAGVTFYLNATPKDVTAKEAREKPAVSHQKNMGNLDSKMFDNILELIKADYVEEVTDEKLLAGALNGMLGSLDPHSAYLDPKSYEELTNQTKGDFGGLGMEVTMENALVKIVSPIDDTPAQKAGLQAGDLILAIDKQPITGMTLLEAVELLRGKPGTKVRLHIKREGKDVFEITLARATIHVKPVKWRLEGNVGYIRLAIFNEETAPLIKDAVADFKKQVGDKLEGLVVDVRNNPGGYYEPAVSSSNLFLTKGQEIVSTKGRNPKIDTHLYADAADIANGVPLVVLINGGSASGSEILAGALQDNHRAVIAGTKSFGKGSVQVVMPLTNGGALKLTIARYYTPTGRSIQAKGIEPDILIDQVYNKLETLDENERIREKNFIGALDLEKQKEETPETSKEKQVPEEEKKKETKEKAEETAEKKKKEVEDYQLMRALDIVRTMAITQRYDKLKEK